MQDESEKLEYKEMAKDDLYKEVVAFANTSGGTILLGISDAGSIAPLVDVDDAYTRVTNGIRDAVAPDVTIFVKYTLEENGIIRIEVGEGSYKPYYLKSKGMKPSGVYVRQGTTSVGASPEQIRLMIKNADGDTFEDLRSMNQDLTFHSCAKTFHAHDVDFGEAKYNALGIRNHLQGLYTNLGLLLSDQCVHTIKVAVFSDEENTVFRDRKEFTGSVLRQMEETYDYLQLCNQNRSVIDGLTRTDYWDYPKDALREALINALIHRDYSFSGSIIINVNDREMEFISLGGLLPGLLQEDIRSGISQLRNRSLAEVFHRLNLIEAYGTGIRRIYALYADCAVQPLIHITPNSFKITLPNMNQASALNIPASKVTSQMQQVIDILSQDEAATEAKLGEILGVKRTRIYNLLRQMESEGLIKISGRGANKRFLLTGGK